MSLAPISLQVISLAVFYLVDDSSNFVGFFISANIRTPANTLSLFNNPKLGRDGRTSEVFGDPAESKTAEAQKAKALTSS